MDKSKIILIVGVVLIVVSFAISAIAIMNMTATISKINQLGKAETEAVSTEPEKVPLEEIQTLTYEDKIITVSKLTADPTRTVSSVFQVGFGFNSTDKTTAELLLQFEEKKDIILNRISKMMAKKDGEFMMESDTQEKIELEIYTMLTEEFEVKPLVEVYVKGFVYSESK